MFLVHSETAKLTADLQSYKSETRLPPSDRRSSSRLLRGRSLNVFLMLTSDCGALPGSLQRSIPLKVLQYATPFLYPIPIESKDETARVQMLE